MRRIGARHEARLTRAGANAAGANAIYMAASLFKSVENELVKICDTDGLAGYDPGQWV